MGTHYLSVGRDVPMDVLTKMVIFRGRGGGGCSTTGGGGGGVGGGGVGSCKKSGKEFKYTCLEKGEEGRRRDEN